MIFEFYRNADEDNIKITRQEIDVEIIRASLAADMLGWPVERILARRVALLLKKK